MVGCFGFNGPLRQYFSLYRAVSQREGEGGERIDESKNVQTTPTRTYCKRNRPLPYFNQNCRTPRHWKFTQHHRTIRPPHPKRGTKRRERIDESTYCKRSRPLPYCTPNCRTPQHWKFTQHHRTTKPPPGRMERWYWVNFQCWGVLLIWIRVRLGSTALAVGAVGGGLDIFSLVYRFFSFSGRRLDIEFNTDSKGR